ncbi:MAG: hypothetical protein IJW45_09660 [Oscillospiraceae bacterium]|nr:hypothetical protein [Oscillospiraceae bacterium]
MKKWKMYLGRLPVYALLLAALGYGLWKFGQEHEPPEQIGVESTEETSGDVPYQKNDGIMPTNVIQIGDTFRHQPYMSEGHFQCKVIGARVVRDASECPPKELFVESGGRLSAGTERYPYEEWFTEGGAYDQGARVVLVDLEVTNVDAVSLLDEEDAFFLYDVIQVADLTKLMVTKDGKLEFYDYWELGFDYLSYYGQYPSEDTMMAVAMKVAQGETVRYTIGFTVDAAPGFPVDVTMLRAILDANSDTQTGVFIDLGLEEPCI